MTTGLLITTAGQAAIAADLGGGTNLVLSHVAFGDSSGIPYTPTEAQTALVNERYRSTISSVAVVANEIIVDAIIPADTNDASARPSHSFNIAECGLYSAAGTLIGVARMGNGYKPPPASGQASIATFRLKLAVSNPSAISVVIDPQAQIIVGRHVRPFWMTIDGFQNTPPVSPATGATYAIGASPTGAWSGFAGRLAQWVGVWSLATVPTGHIVVDNSRGDLDALRFLRFNGTTWVSALMSASQAGFADPAFVRSQALNFVAAAAVGGTANAVTLTFSPAFTSLAQMTGVPVRFIAEATPTQQPTLVPDGLAATPSYGAPWMIGDLVETMYDGARFVHQVIGATNNLAPIFPEIETVSNRLTMTTGAGTVILSGTTETFSHRGSRRFTVGDLALGDRTFSTVANKTYHFRWYPPGSANAPLPTWPNGRLLLRDLADVGYNPSALQETGSNFDTTFDDMLIARVVTNGSNVATITTLANRSLALSSTASRATSTSTFATRPGVPRLTATLNWARTPEVFISEYDADIAANLEAIVAMRIETRQRYDVQVECTGYEAGTGLYVGGRAAIIMRT